MRVSCVCVCVCVCMQGLDPSFCQRLPEWRLNSKYALTVQPHTDMPAAEYPAALVAALQQLRGLRLQPAGEAELHLQGWQWTAAMGEPAAAALSQLAQAGLKISVSAGEHITTDALSALLQVAPHMELVHVWSLDLQSDQHAAAAWPQADLQFTRLDLQQMLRLPHPGLEGVRSIDAATLYVKDYLYQVRCKRGQAGHALTHGTIEVRVYVLQVTTRTNTESSKCLHRVEDSCVYMSVCVVSALLDAG